MTTTSAATGLAAARRLRTGTWTAMPGRTSATFTARTLGRTVHGSVPVRAGDLLVDASGAPVAVHAELDLSGIVTDDARRDRDLRKRSLLDLDNHPTMTFAATTIRSAAVGWRADGVLSLRGTSCPLIVTGGEVDAGDGRFDDELLHVRGTATLDRTQIGMRMPGFLIGRLVQITVDAWLAPPAGA